MIYSASLMQLLYVKWAGWRADSLIDKEQLPIKINDLRFMEKLSFWFFVGCSGFMLLPLRRMIEWVKECCATYIAPASQV